MGELGGPAKRQYAPLPLYWCVCSSFFSSVSASGDECLDSVNRILLWPNIRPVGDRFNHHEPRGATRGEGVWGWVCGEGRQHAFCTLEPSRLRCKEQKSRIGRESAGRARLDLRRQLLRESPLAPVRERASGGNEDAVTKSRVRLAFARQP